MITNPHFIATQTISQHTFTHSLATNDRRGGGCRYVARRLLEQRLQAATAAAAEERRAAELLRSDLATALLRCQRLEAAARPSSL